MALAALEVRGFRSLEEVRLEFAPDANYLFGPNGSGKTSILEAIHYAGTGRSFRTKRDGELLRFGSEFLSVTAEDDRGRVGRLVFDGHEKRFELEGRSFARLSQFFGWLPVVPLLLSDVELVAGPPAQRRSFLDMAGAKVDRAHIGLLNEYGRALKQYNRLLMQKVPGEQLEAWEVEVARRGVALTRGRAAYARFLLARAGELAERLVGRPVEYRFCSKVENPVITRPEGVGEDGSRTDRRSPADSRFGQPDGEAILVETMCEALAASRKRATESGHAVVGSHRDDILIRIGGRSLRRFGSVGEQRAAASALRLAEADFLRAHSVRPAVFLMDEVASELDAARSAVLFEQSRRAGQVLYAAARRFPVCGRVFQLDNGKVRQVQTAG